MQKRPKMHFHFAREELLVQSLREIEDEGAGGGVGGDDEVFVEGDHDLADVEAVVTWDGGVVGDHAYEAGRSGRRGGGAGLSSG